MAKVVVFSTAHCGYCERAKALLNRKGIEFSEVMVDEDLEQRQIMMDRSGRRSVPQIFINDEPIGGSDELHELDKSGELDRLLAES